MAITALDSRLKPFDGVYPVMFVDGTQGRLSGNDNPLTMPKD